jgi:hypothetical protein
MQATIDKLTLEVECAKKERNEVIHGAYMLFHQVKAAGLPPVYVPPRPRHEYPT